MPTLASTVPNGDGVDGAANPSDVMAILVRVSAHVVRPPFVFVAPLLMSVLVRFLLVTTPGNLVMCCGPYAFAPSVVHNWQPHTAFDGGLPSLCSFPGEPLCLVFDVDHHGY